MSDVPPEYEDELAAEIVRLREALADALTLLPPERWRLLLPQYEAERKAAMP